MGRLDVRLTANRPVSGVDESLVIAVAFYPQLLTVTSKFGVHFQPIKKDNRNGCLLAVGVSWKDYIYSPSTLYGADQPFVI